MKNILVTGGAGFIGSNLIKRLFKDVKDATIVNIDNMNAYYDVSLKEYRLENLRRLTDKTVITVTHRPAVLSICDRVLHFTENEVKEV